MPTDWAELARVASAARKRHLTGDTPDALLADLRRQGFELRPDGDRLWVAPPGRLTADLKERISRHKTGLLALLTPRTTPAAPVEPWDADRADLWLKEHLDALQTLEVLASTRSRKRLVAMERELLVRWHQEHNALLWSALEYQQYLLRLWATVPGVEEGSQPEEKTPVLWEKQP